MQFCMPYQGRRTGSKVGRLRPFDCVLDRGHMPTAHLGGLGHAPPENFGNSDSLRASVSDAIWHQFLD